MVGVRAQVPASARTAGVLGTSRSGSGVVIDANGLVVTIGYLILEASEASLVLAGGEEVTARILAYDHESGLGLLRANQPLAVRPMRLGRSSGLGEWEQVLISAYGGVEAARPAYTVSRRPFAGYWEYLLEDAIFTSPPYRLFGGAALVNTEGELLGIGSLVVRDAVQRERAVHGNLFVPIDALKAVLADLLALGRTSKPPRPWLGVFTEELNSGLMVRSLADGGPAQRAGVEPGDLIVGVGDEPVGSMADFYRKVWGHGNAGVTIALQVLRDARIERISVESGDRYDWLILDVTRDS